MQYVLYRGAFSGISLHFKFRLTIKRRFKPITFKTRRSRKRIQLIFDTIVSPPVKNNREDIETDKIKSTLL